ncbi:MAG: seryl-tRNA synthetase [Parcubacteria group bacterium Gr01-1014_20]|nr:MAG: seryl-tRNA synthetase [Parcubacteria group bacterium Gr01-1014_20]
MLDIKLIRENPERVKKGVFAKGVNPKLVDEFLVLDEKWRDLTKKSEDLRAEQRKAGEVKDVEKAKKLKDEIKGLEEEFLATTQKRDTLLLEFPNLPFEDVPVGRDEAGNKVLREVGKKPDFGFEPKDYLTLAKNLDLIDVEKAGEISGSRFGYLKNEAVLLEFALVDLAMKTLIKEGFSLIVPPVLVKPEIMKAMGKSNFIKDKDAYHITEDDLYLVGSSEHSVGPYHMGETFNEKDLPKRYVGFSTCFRREAGSYGKDTKGILRVHQFDKVEMITFSKPEDSEKQHQFMLSMQEKLMKALELPYQVMEICTGDMTFADARQYDIETWLPSENKYRETQSVSNTTDYQARGLNTKYQTRDGKKEFVHMLNGTAFAIGRTVIAIIENFQTKEGKVIVPKALRDYVGKKEIG